jgi:RNA polymerase sigma-70 factor (ECF subfamily)
MEGRQRKNRARERSDETLMERYADGDEEAFEELFRRYEARAYAFFLRRTCSADRARDLYQELFLRIHRGRGAYDPTRPFTPWFFQIAHRLLVDDRRRAYRSHEVTLEDREPKAEQPGSEDRLADRERLAQLLDALSPAERYVLVSSKVDGLGYPELALDLGKSVDAVKKMASRAMQRVRAAPRLGVLLAPPHSR